MEFRITEIGGWYRVRDENNKEYGAGNSEDEAVTEAMSKLRDALIEIQFNHSQVERKGHRSTTSICAEALNE